MSGPFDFDPGEGLEREAERCRGCRHFHHFIEGEPIRVWCKDVMRCVPQPVRTWTIRQLAMVVERSGRKNMNCSDYEAKGR